MKKLLTFILILSTGLLSAQIVKDASARYIVVNGEILSLVEKDVIEQLPPVYTVDQYNALTQSEKDTLNAVIVANTPQGTVDLGDISVAAGVWSLDDDVVAPAEMADGDFGAFTFTTGVAALDANSVGSSQVTDGSLDETDLDTSVNASLDLADSAVQPTDSISGTLISAADLGDLSVAAGVWSVDNVDYDNATSSLAAQDVQSAIDELDSDLTSLTAASVGYSNTTSGLTATQVQAAIDEIAAASTTDSGSGYTYNAITSSDTLNNNQVSVSGSITGKKIWNRVTSNATITLSKDSITSSTPNMEGLPFIIQNYGADSTIVAKGAATTFYLSDSTNALTSDGVIIKQRHPLTVVKDGSSSFFLQGNVETYVDAGCTADPTELHTSSNAASDPNCNEANAVTGWSTVQATITSVTTDPQNGSYHFDIESDEGTSDRAEYSFSVTSGNVYRISFKAYTAVGTTGMATSWVGFDSDPDLPSFDYFSTTVWETKTYDLTASTTGTAIIRLYCNDSSGSAALGDTIYIDNLSITDITP